jgi:hypothetical protein
MDEVKIFDWMVFFLTIETERFSSSKVAATTPRFPGSLISALTVVSPRKWALTLNGRLQKEAWSKSWSRSSTITSLRNSSSSSVCLRYWTLAMSGSSDTRTSWRPREKFLGT